MPTLLVAAENTVDIFPINASNQVQKVRANFLYEDRRTSLNLHWHAQEAALHNDGLNIFMNHTHVLTVTSKKSIDQLRFVGIARSSESKMDHLVLLASYGDLWPSDLIFIFYDHRTRSFVQHYVVSKDTGVRHHPYLHCRGSQVLNGGRSFRPCLSLWERAGKNALLGERVFRELKPITAFINRQRGKNILATRLIPTHKIENTFETVRSMRDPNFDIDILDENSRWKILLMSFDSPDRESWGLLLAFDKQKKQWMSFYSLPKSSKISLFVPVVELINESTLQINTCIDCRMWGEKVNVIVNMESMVASISPY